MFRIDLHTHTRFFHWNAGEPTRFDPVGARLLEAAARLRGMDGVALTNHDYYRPFGSDAHEVVKIPGIEVTTTAGHVLVVGPDPPDRTNPGALTPGEIADRARDRGCATILAHPFRNSTVAESGALLDAVEVNGKHPDRRTMVEDLADELDLPLVGGSDAHFPFEVGRAYTVVDADEPTPRAVVDAVRDGRVEPRVHTHPVYKILQRLYRGVHEYKGHVDVAVRERERPPEQ